jgi:general secretion pathway protein C
MPGAVLRRRMNSDFMDLCFPLAGGKPVRLVRMDGELACLPCGMASVDHNARMQQRPFSQRLAQRANPSGAGQLPAAAAGARSGAALAAGLLWLAAGLSAGYWFLQVKGQGPWTPLQGLAPSAPQADTDTVARALGATISVEPVAAAVPVPAVRLQLLGVVVQGRQQGAALIAVDDQPPRPWRVGAVVADGLVLQSVDRRSVRLGETRSGPTSLELTVPPQPTDEAPE